MPQTLYHFSEDPTIETFRPHRAFGQEDKPPCVWAIDAEYAPLYWFPRDCPRITFWADDGTTEADKERFLGLGTAKRVHAIESLWLGRMRDCTLYAYRFDATLFERYPEACGYHVAYTEVVPLRCEPVGDLLERHVEAAIELRVTPSLWPLQRAVATSSLQFSMNRLRNAQPPV